MSRITEIFGQIGNGLYEIVKSDNTLYGVYLIAFFFGIFSLFSFLLGKLKLFQENGKKPAKVVALMISIITTGSIFYGTGPGARSVHDLLMLFHGFGGFLFLLILTIAFVAGGVFMFNKHKEKNFKFAMLILTTCLYIASSLLLPQFNYFVCGSFTHSQSGFSGGYSYSYFSSGELNCGGYVGLRAGPSFVIFKDILSWIQDISLILLIVYLFLVIADLFKSKDDGVVHNNREKQKPDQKTKDIADAKELINSMINDLRESNNHFNNKINLLNMLRRDIGNIPVQQPNNQNNNNGGGN